ncbi:hypothetical protein OH416_02605, partial [Salmonella enterica]|nr:hypothetical protein [Salmonella enterica]
MKRLLFLLMMMQFTQLGYAACNATLTNTKDYTIQSDSLMLGGGGGGEPIYKNCLKVAKFF